MKTKDFIKAINALPTLKEKQLFYLNDVANHYNSTNRCTDGMVCKYEPITEWTEGCAIGRRLSAKLQKQLDTNGHDTGVNNYYVFEKLPKWMQDLGKNFLRSIQMLHDDAGSEGYWSVNGLSKNGEDRVMSIKREFDLYESSI